jgi:hypothetical protein
MVITSASQANSRRHRRKGQGSDEDLANDRGHAERQPGDNLEGPPQARCGQRDHDAGVADLKTGVRLDGTSGAWPRVPSTVGPTPSSALSTVAHARTPQASALRVRRQAPTARLPWVRQAPWAEAPTVRQATRVRREVSTAKAKAPSMREPPPLVVTEPSWSIPGLLARRPRSPHPRAANPDAPSLARATPRHILRCSLLHWSDFSAWAAPHGRSRVSEISDAFGKTSEIRGRPQSRPRDCGA